MVLCLVGAALALGWDWLYLRQVSAPMEALVGSRQTLTMTLAEYPAETSFGAKVTVQAEGLPGKLTYYGDSTLLQLTPGQRITDDVYLQSASRIRDDDVAVFNSKGVFLLAYSRGTPAFGRGDPEAVRWWPVRLGHRMQAQIRTLFSGDDAGFLLALLTGRKGELSAQADVDLSEAGVYHILAVSGMHCAYLLALVEFLTGKHRRRLTAAVSIPILIFYALLTGASPSVVRACVMLSLLTAAPLFRRESDPPTALLTALFLILAANPFAAKSVSLQLSFGAVTGLLWLSPKVLSGLMGTKKKHGRLTAATAASVSATTGCHGPDSACQCILFRQLCTGWLSQQPAVPVGGGDRIRRRAAGGTAELCVASAGDAGRPCAAAVHPLYSGSVSRPGGSAVSRRLFLQSVPEVVDGISVSPVCCCVADEAQGAAEVRSGCGGGRSDAGGNGMGRYRPSTTGWMLRR